MVCSHHHSQHAGQGVPVSAEFNNKVQNKDRGKDMVHHLRCKYMCKKKANDDTSPLQSLPVQMWPQPLMLLFFMCCKPGFVLCFCGREHPATGWVLRQIQWGEVGKQLFAK